MTEAEWLASSADMRKYILENAQTYMQNQLGLATAADQRAASLAGAFSAVATAVLAALVAVVGLANPDLARPLPVITAGIVTSLSFLISAALCVIALLPTSIWVPGSAPKSWYEDVEKNVNFDICLFTEITNIQEKIEDNRKTIEKNAKNFKHGALLGLSAPIFGAGAWAIVYYWHFISSWI